MLDFTAHPGRAFVAATLLPLVPVALLLLAGTVRNLTRAHRTAGGWKSAVYWLLGGDQPLKFGGYLGVAALLGSATLAGWGTVTFFADAETLSVAQLEPRWAESTEWVRIGAARADGPAVALDIGYRIDRLTALMVSMVTGIGSLIFIFALGYMRGEAAEVVEDHDTHRLRRGRFGRFYLYLCLFAFSMLNLLIADNLFQVFVSWELVGVCSFFLIGFYYEKRSACLAANKAFLVNRVGDAGFLIGIAIAFTTFGTLNFQELNAQFADGKPDVVAHGLWVAMGLGLFLGCVGKSAQVPLQTWLPDAMEGPTPVSALIHAATMVAAGVYLVGRCYPMFAPEVLLIIAYCGLVTLFMSAMTALVMTDIKRVLAYSTCSQLGYMMLALGVGGWTAGLFHLLTHAFFKALLFLCAGSVIHGCHHEQDLRKMGGLRKKMPITAFAMLVGVLAIAGTPFFSGWYSKDMILSSALGFGLAHQSHLLLFVVPLLTAGLTAFYMFRLWFLAFAGTPRDHHVSDHAHESPAVMTLPLVVLAACSIGVAWGWPVWDAEASHLGHLIHAGEPKVNVEAFVEAHEMAEQYHLWAGGLALLAAVGGFAVAWANYARRAPTEAQLKEPAGVLAERWYFDRAYDALFVNGTIRTARASAAFDKAPPDSNRPTLDNAFNALAGGSVAAGTTLGRAQTGFVRRYVFVMALTLLTALGILVATVR